MIKKDLSKNFENIIQEIKKDIKNPKKTLNFLDKNLNLNLKLKI